MIDRPSHDTSRLHWTRFALLLLALTSGITACERALSDAPPPLRPLVYTEGNEDASDALNEAPPPPRFPSPDDLGVAVYQALVEHDHELFIGVFVSSEELFREFGWSEERALRYVPQIILKSDEIWSLCEPGHTSEEPVGGLGSRLQLLSFDLGSGRDLSGKRAKSGEEKMFVNNTLHLQLRNSNKSFRIKLPTIIRAQLGWKLRDPIDADATFKMYLKAGMHLKPELLHNEHHPYPLAVGNTWKYRLKGLYGELPPPPPPPVEEDEDDENTPDDGEPPEPDKEPEAPVQVGTFEHTRRVTVEALESHEAFGFNLVKFVDVLDSFEQRQQTFYYLVTPKHIYRCTPDCRQRVAEQDIAYLLGFMNQQSPLFVFPLQTGEVWGKAGSPRAKKIKYRVEQERQFVQVPFGDFSGVYVILDEENQEARYFVPGTGTIHREVFHDGPAREERLIGSRLMP